MIDFLGTHISEILDKKPFKQWAVERSIEDGLPDRIIEYVFTQNGLEVHCDADENINVIFIFSEEYEGFKENLFEIPISETSDYVRNYYGMPSKSGDKCRNEFFGDLGAWDRFDKDDYSLHFEYNYNSENINKITIICASVVAD